MTIVPGKFGGGGGGTPVQETPSGTIDGANTAFTLAFTPRGAAYVKLYLDGAILKQTTHYSISGVNITMVSAPTAAQDLYAVYEK